MKNLNTHTIKNKQADTINKNKITGIKSILPSLNSPNFINIDNGFTEEVFGGMDVGCQEKTSKLHDGVTKEGSLTDVLLEELVDLWSDFRASEISKNMQQQGEK